MITISERLCAGLYIYIYKEKLRDLLYTKIRTLCKKQDNLRYILCSKGQTLYVTRFFIRLLNWHLYTKSMIFCVMLGFIYKIPDTS